MVKKRTQIAQIFTDVLISQIVLSVKKTKPLCKSVFLKISHRFHRFRGWFYLTDARRSDISHTDFADDFISQMRYNL